MKRTLAITAGILLFLSGFVVSVIIFVPYREAGKLAVTIAEKQLQKRGMRLKYSYVSGSEGGFTLHDAVLSGMAEISVSSVTFKPEIMRSILTVAPVCGIEFEGLSVRMGQTFRFGNGGLLLTLSGGEIVLENLHTDGEFSLNGWITADPVNMKIVHADAEMGMPEEFSRNIGILRNVLPLEQEGGRWYLRRK